MPWAIFNRPSLQLATLKGYIETQSPCKVDCFHPYLDIARTIGGELYHKISLSGWGGEALFSALLFPEKKEAAKELFLESLMEPGTKPPNFELLLTAIETSFANWLPRVPARPYLALGFSVCFSQLLSSLYAATKLKEKYPGVPVIFGGSSCSGQAGRSLAEHFEVIDFVVEGEGEKSLLRLIEYLGGINTTMPPTVFARSAGSDNLTQEEELVLDELPYPDFQCYFEEAKRVFADQPFIPVLPIEFSRGCWWHKCAFCNLNLQWKNYRSKSSERMFRELMHFIQQHEVLNFTFADNALPPGKAETFFTNLSQQGRDLEFFSEIRAQTSPQSLAIFYKGGMRTAQVGIEALSSSLLQKMQKGTSCMENITIMKQCSRLGLNLEGNLIVGFPGSSPEEVAETLRNLDYVLPYHPLQAATFFLGYGAPIHSRPGDFSIGAVTTHKKARKIFPDQYLPSLQLLICGYRGDKGRQKELWGPVSEKIKVWQQFHNSRKHGSPHPLHYRDGGNFLIIRQELPGRSPFMHRLRGLSRKLYLYCETPTDFATLLRDFPKVRRAALANFVAEMCTKNLMFQEDNRVLSLAVSLDSEAALSKGCHGSEHCS